VATNFPTSLDSLTNPTSTDSLTSPSHAGQHADANDAIEALQAKVGVNSSAVTSSLDYKVEGLLAVSQSNRNVVVNGAMQVAQRATSVTSNTAGGYLTADRFNFLVSSFGTWTQDIQNDAPTGSGFRKSLRMLCTTADASPAAGDNGAIQQRFEGQNLQQFAKGTSSAKQFTLSFWVKSNVTGTYIAELDDQDNSRSVSASYSISASATWEKKTITFPADTTGAFDNDSAHSLSANFWLGAGTTFTSGTLATSWASRTNANRAVGQVNVAAATNNYWQITGVQLEVGAVATPFEFEDYGTTLAKCQRYYWRGGNGSPGIFNGSNTARYSVTFPTSMRAAPTATAIAAPIVINPTIAEQQTGSQTTNFSVTGFGASVDYSVAQIQFGGFSSGADGRPTTLLNTALEFSIEL
jgi:hypothetical protein